MNFPNIPQTDSNIRLKKGGKKRALVFNKNLRFPKNRKKKVNGEQNFARSYWKENKENAFFFIFFQKNKLLLFWNQNSTSTTMVNSGLAYPKDIHTFTLAQTCIKHFQDVPFFFAGKRTHLANPSSLGCKKLLTFFDVKAYPTTSFCDGGGGNDIRGSISSSLSSSCGREISPFNLIKPSVSRPPKKTLNSQESARCRTKPHNTAYSRSIDWKIRRK